MKSKNTYSLILNAEAEDKRSSVFETVVYAAVILGMAISSWNFVSSKVTLPGENRAPKSEERILATVPAEQPAPIVLASRG